MINIKQFFKNTQLALAVLVLVMTASHAQTVSVPEGCTVVVAGIGGVLGTGPTGKVGDGGMVAMPDPGGGGTFTFNPPAGATTPSWTLKGDLSNSTTTPDNYNSPTQPADGLTANIITYNKKYRPTSTEQTNSSYARSKGQVEIIYNQSGSGSSITFDVFKTFTTALPIIVGPTCLKPNTQYTYSVDQIVSDNANDAIGFDSYYWSGIPNSIISSSSFYVSADTSSITFTTGDLVTPITLQCCYGRLNPNTADGGVSTVAFPPGSHSTCVTKSLVGAPLAPEFISTTLTTLATLNAPLAPAACLPTGQNTFTITYPNPPSGFTYTWTAPNTGWTFSTSSASESTKLTVTTTKVANGNNNLGLLTLTISGSCEDTLFNYQINRNLVK
ncbi:hypothetical protein [Flavobacterium luteum]|uniref:Ig-like domain-containing protein n=1 Tax=Flavobacterium luteum TaxID=2026654 RepID=A0A7J5AH34_9FLAO|nr:hypothetical protein [Flavobacterium luteum]KAB1156932.1 hypothetical protein F6464_06165 [Flavobacterium luteum]